MLPVLLQLIAFGKKSTPSACTFSHDGQYLVSGSQDGFVEVWDYQTGNLRKDLEFQVRARLRNDLNDGCFV